MSFWRSTSPLGSRFALTKPFWVDTTPTVTCRWVTSIAVSFTVKTGMRRKSSFSSWRFSRRPLTDRAASDAVMSGSFSPWA